MTADQETSRAEALRRRLAAEGARGLFQIIPSPVVTEALSLSGADFVLVDGEHGAFGIERLEEMVRAGEARGLTILYRAASSADDLAKALDSGVAGIVVPRVESVEEALAAIRATRFPPLGARGVGPGRAGFFGLDMGALRDEAALVVLMIETRAGLEALEEIVALEGVDVIMVGPYDLAASLGLGFGSPEHERAIARIREAATAAGRICGVHCPDPETAARRQAEGFRFLTVGFDTACLVEGARAMMRR